MPFEDPGDQGEFRISARLQDVDMDYVPAFLQSTGDAKDVAIQGEGFFRVAQLAVTPPAVTVPAGTDTRTSSIPGTRRSQHLQQNLAAAQATLPAEVTDALDALFAPGRVAGARYTEAGWVGIEASATT